MSIWNILFGIVKTVLPFLRSAAEKAFNSLPKDEQVKLIQVSKLVELIKLSKGKTAKEVETLISGKIGISKETAFAWLIEYWQSKGHTVGSLKEAIELLWADASTRTETGLKSLWSGLNNIVSAIVTNVDWQALLFGIGEYVYRTYVKGRIKI